MHVSERIFWTKVSPKGERKMKKEKARYEKPVLIKEKTMNFPIEIINALGGGRMVCHQCSNCHGCI